MPAAVLQHDILRDDVEQAVLNLEKSTESGSKTKAANVKPDVDIICKYAADWGLSSEYLQSLLSLITRPDLLDQTSQNALLRNLYPAGPVSEEILYLIVSSLGPGKHRASVTTQQTLLKWLVLVYDLVEPPSAFFDVYSVIFNLLDLLHLRIHLCHLLARTTRRQHVKPFRIHFLQKLDAGLTKEVNLVKLIQTFDSILPGSLDVPRSKQPISFANPDAAWTDRLRSIQLRNGAALPLNALSLEGYRIIQDVTAKSQVIETQKRSEEVLGLRKVEDIARNFEKLEINELTRDDLGNQILQQYLSLRPEKTNQAQLDALLGFLLDREREELDDGDGLGLDILDHVRAYAAHIKSLPEQVVAYLRRHFPTWRPILEPEKEESILDILSYLPILSWADLHSNFLGPLDAVLLDGSTKSFTKLMTFHTRLIDRWTASLLLQAQQSSQIESGAAETVQRLIERTTTLALSSLVHSNLPSQGTISIILDHLESQVALASAPISITFTPPPPILIYSLLFANGTALSTISRVSSLLGRFKTAVELQQQQQTPQSQQPSGSSSGGRPAEHIHTLNAELIDTCNLLLRSRAFNTSDAHALGCLMHNIPSSNATKAAATAATPSPDPKKLGPENKVLVPALTTYARDSCAPSLDLAHLFSLSCHPALANLAMTTFRELEQAEGQKADTVTKTQAASTFPPVSAKVKRGKSTRKTDGETDIAGADANEPSERAVHIGPVSQKSLAQLGRDGGVKIGWREYRVHVLQWLEARGVDGVGNLGRATMRGLMGNNTANGNNNGADGNQVVSTPGSARSGVNLMATPRVGASSGGLFVGSSVPRPGRA